MFLHKLSCAPFVESINKATEKSKEEDSYRLMIDSVKSGPEVKQLLAQFIPRFCQFFPQLSEQAINAQLDLCEDEKLNIRVFAIRGLAEICKGDTKTVPRIGDVLGQLLLAEDPIELQTVQRTFAQLFELDLAGAFAALFLHIKDGEDALRAKAIKFLAGQLKDQAARVRTNEPVQEALVAGIKDVLHHESGVTAQEFDTFLDLLKTLPVYAKNKQHAADLVTVLAKQAHLDKDFEVS